jgi:hypothetical protein
MTFSRSGFFFDGIAMIFPSFLGEKNRDPDDDSDCDEEGENIFPWTFSDDSGVVVVDEVKDAEN